MADATARKRTSNYLRQISETVVYKTVSIVASFVTIPLLISYIGQEQFGVWSTLLTVMSWIVFFDLGVGNGLRNSVAETLAKENQAAAARYISSGYSMIGLMALFLWMLVFAASWLINWQLVFNTRAIPEVTLRHTVQITTFFIILNFWIGLIGALLGAIQRTSLIALGQLITNTLVLALVIVLAQTTDGSITHLAIAHGSSLVIANILLSIWFYHRYPRMLPAPCLDKQHIQPLLAVGIQFFVIQIAVLVIFTTDKILIAQLFGPIYVTQYEVTFKLFSLITFVHSMITAPLWSAYTDAYSRGDIGWIKDMLQKQTKIFIGVVIAAVIMVLLAQPIIRLWIGTELDVSFALILALGMLVIISTWNNIFAMFVNGIGKIRIQLYTAVIAMSINIPLALLFTKYFKFGLSGIVLATCASLLFAAIALPLQVRQIIGENTKSSPA